MLCPESHPFPCQGGKKCSKSAWKPASGSEADCDGTQLRSNSLCCPADSVDCSTDPNWTCRPNPSYGEILHCFWVPEWILLYSKPSIDMTMQCLFCQSPPVSYYLIFPVFRKALNLNIQNKMLGHLCPSSHPFTCAEGSMCSRLKWKPTSGSDADCDGTTLGPSSVCCPLYGNVPCNGDTRYKCLENPSMQGL